jgi:hypothetical protein
MQFITIEDWGHHSSWATHIEGATTLLQIRGPKQFGYERGEQLFSLLLSQIVRLVAYSSSRVEALQS